MSDFAPSFVPRKPKKFTDEPWLSFDEPQVILWQGMRSSGKGVAVDNTAEQLYKAGINIWHLWGARSFENLYWAVNKNCIDHYKKMKIITDAFYQKEIHGLENYCLQNGLKKEEYERYLKIMQEEKMILLCRVVLLCYLLQPLCLNFSYLAKELPVVHQKKAKVHL